MCSVAKQFGMQGSLALDKMRKRGARSTIFVFDILDPKDRALLYHWLESPLLVWLHMAPVCGTCSRARQIRNGGPRALRSDQFPMGLPTLNAAEKHRVDLANSMYWETCKLFSYCASLGILVTLENPSRSLFWLTEPFLQLLDAFDIFFSNTQMCMMGGSRPKWTKLAASFSAISEMDVECDNSHSHLPWGKTLDDEGNEVFATSLEAQYPRKFCHALVQCVVRQLQRQGMQVLPDSLFDVRNERVFEMQTARISAQQQSRRSKLPPLISDVASVAVFYVQQPSDVPCSLQCKLDKPLSVFTESGMSAQVPQLARFLRRTATHLPFSLQGGL